MNKKSKNLLESLYSVDCGGDVYEALKEVPTDNLKDMREMIDFILNKRHLLICTNE